MRGFWHKPREQRWRGWIFRIHLWSGLTIGLWAIIIGVSGSVLVFKDEIESLVESKVFTVEPQPGRASLDAVVAKIGDRFPEHTVLGFGGLNEKKRSHLVRIGRRDTDRRIVSRFYVHYNQYTGEILGSYPHRSGFFGFFEKLHFYLFMGRTGMKVNAFFGLALLTMCATGIVIWWPGAKRWREGIRVKWGAGRKRVNYDLHRATGFSVAVLLAVMAFTGFYFGFPFVVMEALTRVAGADAAEVRKFFRGPKSQVVEGAPRISLDLLIRKSAKLFLPGTELSRISVPARANGAFTLAGVRSGNPALRGRTGAYIDQYSGQVLASFDSREQSPGMRLALMLSPIHFGLWGGMWSKGLWFLLGLAPGTLITTGFLMWWNRVAGKRYRAWRQSSLDTPAKAGPGLSQTVTDKVQA
ncbi:MAG: PepSY-associated TM helix domain-containing protein [Acidobacteriota bacterium]|nr:PepSY-associated TM helix domain-containing protein [Acidobacteriota bacterium]